ncbi:MAG TPA: hypothetical protein PK530_16990 [Anaerolineales bacterium]|nr:hypothetical protein [Anaerolineales bacterium]
MKTIIRILIIFAFAALVVGGLVAMRQSAWASQLLPQGRGGEFGEGFEPPQGFQPPEGFERPFGEGDFGEFGERSGRGERGGGFSLFGILGFAQTLIPMTLIIIVFTQIPKLWHAFRLRQKTKTSS